jgi:hypothetical protein
MLSHHTERGQGVNKGADVHVVYAFGSEYIVPAFVAVNSTLHNSKDKERLVIHLLVEDAIVKRVEVCYVISPYAFVLFDMSFPVSTFRFYFV